MPTNDKAKYTDVTPSMIRKIIDYDPDTGDMVWKERPREMFSTERGWKITNTRCVGQPVVIDSDVSLPKAAQHVNISVKGTRYTFMAHIVAFCHYHGFWPNTHLRLVNGDPRDLRIANIIERPVKGVCYIKNLDRWVAYYSRNKTQIRVGSYKTEKEALIAREEAMRNDGVFDVA